MIGSAGGSIDMFNLQSGQHRQSFPSKAPKYRGAMEDTKHNKAVTGLAVDSLNRTVVSSGMDGKVKVMSSFNTNLN